MLTIVLDSLLLVVAVIGYNCSLVGCGFFVLAVICVAGCFAFCDVCWWLSLLMLGFVSYCCLLGCCVLLCLFGWFGFVLVIVCVLVCGSLFKCCLSFNSVV